jgi:hypothetical protein
MDKWAGESAKSGWCLVMKRPGDEKIAARWKPDDLLKMNDIEKACRPFFWETGKYL